MIFRFPTSAGEFFELIRPAVLVLSALASIWVLASARRYRFVNYVAITFALGTLFFPLITLPLYLIARFIRRPNDQPAHEQGERKTISSPPPLQHRIGLPLAYATIVFTVSAFYLYWDHQSVDGHLARAVQAKLSGNRVATINEYRAALTLEDNPHTRKLLAIELADSGEWAAALFELRLAEKGGVDDDRIALYIATLLESLNLPNQAILEYQRFLESRSCTQPLPDERCAAASTKVRAAQSASRPG